MKLPRLLRRSPAGAEHRGGGYTGAALTALLQAADGSADANAGGIAAVEIAAGLWARAFASATVSGSNAVTPGLLAMIGRALLRSGEFVAALEIERGELALLPAASWEVAGSSPREADWLYRLDLPTPSGGAISRTLPAAGVVHARYAAESVAPWRGIGPVAWAQATGKLAAALELRLGQEASAPVALLIPAPQQLEDDSADDPLDGLRRDLLAAKGTFLLVESMSGGWQEHQARQSRADDWAVRRMGATIPPGNVALRSDVFVNVLGICGVPPSLAAMPADGGAQREGYRRFVASTIAPIAKTVAAELSAKLETPISIRFPELAHADVSARARAFGSLVGAGMDASEARELAGLNA